MAGRRATSSAQRTLDVAGAAAAELLSAPWGQRFEVRRVTTTTSETTGSAELRLYRNSVSEANFVDGTYNAKRDASEFSPALELHAGESLLAKWTEGTPGATATATVDYLSERA